MIPAYCEEANHRSHEPLKTSAFNFSNASPDFIWPIALREPSKNILKQQPTITRVQRKIVKLKRSRTVQGWSLSSTPSDRDQGQNADLHERSKTASRNVEITTYRRIPRTHEHHIPQDHSSPCDCANHRWYIYKTIQRASLAILFRFDPRSTSLNKHMKNNPEHSNTQLSTPTTRKWRCGQVRGPALSLFTSIPQMRKRKNSSCSDIKPVFETKHLTIQCRCPRAEWVLQEGFDNISQGDRTISLESTKELTDASCSPLHGTLKTAYWPIT